MTYRTQIETPPQLDAFKVEVPIRAKRKIDHIIYDCIRAIWRASRMLFLLARI